MARYTGPNCRLCRREGTKLFLKGERCYSQKCSMETRSPNPPGVLGKRRRRKLNSYGQQLREKQKVRRIYGILEKQFRKYFKMASNRKGVTGTLLLQILESRLDNVVFRAGFGASRKAARQLVNHGHIAINSKKVDIPSYLVKIGDTFEVVGKSLSNKFVNEALENRQSRGLPSWMQLDFEKKKVVLNAFPERSDLQQDIQEHLIVELYSK